MAGLDKNTPHPIEIKLHKQSRLLEVTFSDGKQFSLPFEFLRVYSPSAAVRGHMPSQAVLQTGKRNVDIVDIQPVGHYAIKLVFSDGHDTGLYSWDVLYRLGAQQDTLWQDYLNRLEAAGASRDIDTTPSPHKKSGCGH